MEIEAYTYKLKETKKTPEIVFNQNTGQLSIFGKSLPEDAFVFYKDIFDHVCAYLNKPCETTTIIIELEYSNSISSKLIFRLLSSFEELASKGKEVKIHWHYYEDDDMMLEMGEVFNSSLKIEINLLEMAL